MVAPQQQCYASAGTPFSVTFGDSFGFDASSAFGCLHYVPPDAISNRYYALQDPNVYMEETQRSSSSPPVATTAAADTTTCVPMTVKPSAKIEVEEPPMGSLTPPMGSLTPPMGSLTPPMASLRPPHGLHPGASAPKPAKSANFGAPRTLPFAHPGEHSSPAPALVPMPAPSTSPARADPVLPKQRRNRDDPGGDTGLMAQRSAQFEVGLVQLCLGENGRFM